MIRRLMCSGHVGRSRLAVGVFVAGLLAITAVDIGPGVIAPTASFAAEQAPADLGGSAAAQEARRQVAAARVPRIRWQRCDESFGLFKTDKVVRCARIRVPLDYDDPDGETTRLQLTRRPAAGRSVGSLFVNLGGPGGRAAAFVAFNGGRLLSPMVARRMDVIGVNPRGTGGSGRTTCLTRGAEPTRDPAFPVTAEDEAVWLAADDTLRRICDRDATALVDHASTADNARDMELVRRAIKEPRINFYGVSYGSYFGATYAALFPDRIRTMIVDGVLDPVAWATGTAASEDEPFSVRVGSGFGSYEALTSAWSECDRVGSERCPLAPNAQQKWDEVLEAARSRPIDAFDEPQTYKDIVSFTSAGLYSRRSYKPTARVIAALHSQLLARGTLESRTTTPEARRLEARARAATAKADGAYRLLMRAKRQRAAIGPYAASGPSRLAGARRLAPKKALVPKKADVLFDAVVCSDTVNPRDPAVWTDRAPKEDRATPWFGRLWSWSSSPCARGGIGSDDDAFRGPWDTRTSAPLLIVTSTHDPATPISGARAMATHFEGSSVLTFNGWNHGALGEGPCIQRAMGEYLVEEKLPANGSVCQPPKPLFP